MADQYGNRIPSQPQFGGQSSLTNEMIRDQNIQNTSTIINHNHQQFIQNRQQMETMRIATQLHQRQQLQQQPNATNSFYINKFKQIRQRFGLHKHTLNRSFSYLANASSISSPNPAPSAQLHPPASNIFTNSFINSIHNPTAPTHSSIAPLAPTNSAVIPPISQYISPSTTNPTATTARARRRSRIRNARRS